MEHPIFTEDTFFLIYNHLCSQKDRESLKTLCRTTLDIHKRRKGCLLSSPAFYENYELKDLQASMVRFLLSTDNFITLSILPSCYGKTAISLIYCYERYLQFGGVTVLSLPKGKKESVIKEIGRIWTVPKNIYYSNNTIQVTDGVIICERSKLLRIDMTNVTTVVIDSPSTCMKSISTMIEQLMLKCCQSTRVVMTSHCYPYFPINRDLRMTLHRNMVTPYMKDVGVPVIDILHPEVDAYGSVLKYHPIVLEESTNYSVFFGEDVSSYSPLRPQPDIEDYITYYNGKRRYDDDYTITVNSVEKDNREYEKALSVLLSIILTSNNILLAVDDQRLYASLTSTFPSIDVVCLKANRITKRDELFSISTIIFFNCKQSEKKMKRLVEMVSCEKNRNREINIWLLCQSESLIFSVIAPESIIYDYQLALGKKDGYPVNISLSMLKHFPLNMSLEEMTVLSYWTPEKKKMEQWIIKRDGLQAFPKVEDIKTQEVEVVKKIDRIEDVPCYVVTLDYRRPREEKKMPRSPVEIDLDKLQDAYDLPRGGYSLNELKDICKDRGLKVRGTKRELAERIAELL